MAVADSDPNVIYLGTGSDDVRSNVSTGRGMYKTTDGGLMWKFIGLYDAGQIGSVRIHPTNPNIVWVSAQGDAFCRISQTRGQEAPRFTWMPVRWPSRANYFPR